MTRLDDTTRKPRSYRDTRSAGVAGEGTWPRDIARINFSADARHAGLSLRPTEAAVGIVLAGYLLVSGLQAR